MKHAVTTVVLLSFFSVLALAQAQEHPEWTTSNALNGRFWMTMDGHEKLLYLQACREGIGVGLVANPSFKEEIGKNWFPFNLPNGDIVKGVDKFFDEPENLRFPIREAMAIFAMKVAGASQNLIDQRMHGLRKQYP